MPQPTRLTLEPTLNDAEPPRQGTTSPGLHAPLPPLLARYVFSWETMHTIIGGQSAIDLSHLRLVKSGEEEARQFLLRYGYDLHNPVHFQEVERIRTEALGFIRGVLLPGLNLVMPAEFDTMPILDVLRLAAGDAAVKVPRGELSAELRMAWACGLLRVMHTVAHAVNYFQSNYYPEIREKILSRFVAQVHTAEDGSQYLHSQSFDVPIVRFEVKETKPLRSVVVKLLQKQENVAYDLFDHIGVRIIVQNPVDALFAVRALREEHTIMYPNVKPTRSRNTLVDLQAYDVHVRKCLERFQRGEIDEVACVAAINAFDHKPHSHEQVDWNPYSSDKYQSIQFTCRQMIRFANPLFTRLNEAQRLARKHLHGAALEEMLANLSLNGVDSEIQFFFPYEVQVMDIASYQAATEGRASYAEYKTRQIASVRKRVLPRVLELVGLAEPSTQPRPPRPQVVNQPVPLRRAFGQTGILPLVTPMSQADYEAMRAELSGD